MILLITGSSTELALFHAGCRPSPHVGLLQHLYLTYSSKRHSTHIHPGWNHILAQQWKIYVLPSKPKPHPTHNDGIFLYFHLGWNHILPQWWKGSTLTSIQDGTHPAHNHGRACTHIWSCRNQSYSHIRMATSPQLSYLVNDQVPPFS